MSKQEAQQSKDPGRRPEGSLPPGTREVKQTKPLLQIVMVLIVVGVLLRLINRFIPMAGSIKTILNAVAVIVVVLWLLNVFGIFHSMSGMHVGT
jgi:hypothetical protein